MKTWWSWTCLLALCSVAAADSPDIVAAARAQIGVTRLYDGGYRVLRYPGGDVPAELGVCTDVVVRALRQARALDLQQAIHEDLVAHRAGYVTRRWGDAAPDANIDHRRVPNQMTWFRRQGWALAPTQLASDYLPGDIVAWDLGHGVLHVGIVSDRVAGGTPRVIHNIGAGAREDDILFRFAIIGHYRPPPAPAGARRLP